MRITSTSAFIGSIIVVVMVLLSGCAINQEVVGEEQNIKYYKEENDLNMNTNFRKNQTAEPSEVIIEPTEMKSERIFVDLEYLGMVDNADFSDFYRAYNLVDDVEFTWWEHHSIWSHSKISQYFDFNLPDEVNNMEYDVVFSFGRELKSLYYYEKDYHIQLGGYKANPVFAREYKKNTAHIYLIMKTNIANSEFASSDIGEFNVLRNIPFELPPE